MSDQGHTPARPLGGIKVGDWVLSSELGGWAGVAKGDSFPGHEQGLTCGWAFYLTNGNGFLCEEEIIEVRRADGTIWRKGS